jgi:hypothetical protein
MDTIFSLVINKNTNVNPVTTIQGISIDSEKYKEQICLAELYRQAELLSLAEITEARIIIKVCDEVHTPIYLKDKYGMHRYHDYYSRNSIGRVDTLEEFCGSIPLDVVKYLINSKLNTQCLSILTLQDDDPILLLRFFCSRRVDDEFSYHMELLRWD